MYQSILVASKSHASTQLLAVNVSVAILYHWMMIICNMMARNTLMLQLVETELILTTPVTVHHILKKITICFVCKIFVGQLPNL